MLITTVKLYRYGGKVVAGEEIGTAGDPECYQNAARARGQQQSSGTFVRIELFRRGRPIDPTYHLIDCMCTGQICETNGNNALIGEAFKYAK